MRRDEQYIEIEIDKLTDSIENVRTGDRFLTDILLVDKADMKEISKANGVIGNGQYSKNGNLKYSKIGNNRAVKMATRVQ